MIHIQQDRLHAALHAVTRASLKSSLAAFSLVRLDAQVNGVLRLSCFNGETAARALTQARIEAELAVRVDAQTLKAVVETLADEIQLFVEDGALVIKSGANRTTLRLVDEALPVLGDEVLQPLATLHGSTWRSLSRVLPFASTDGARPMLQVLHLTFDAGGVTAQAADGYSAACVRESREGPGQSSSLFLPLSFARLLSTVVEERDTVRVASAGENRYLFQISNLAEDKDLTLATVSSAETFPSAQILSLTEDADRSAVATLQVQQPSLLQSIRMVQAMGTETTFLKATDGSVKIASLATEAGQSRNLLDGTASGAPASVWLSAAFLKRAVEACKGELSIRLAENRKPILVAGGSFTAIIMPMAMEAGRDPFAEEDALAMALPHLAAA